MWLGTFTDGGIFLGAIGEGGQLVVSKRREIKENEETKEKEKEKKKKRRFF